MTVPAELPLPTLGRRPVSVFPGEAGQGVRDGLHSLAQPLPSLLAAPRGTARDVCACGLSTERAMVIGSAAACAVL